MMIKICCWLWSMCYSLTWSSLNNLRKLHHSGQNSRLYLLSENFFHRNYCGPLPSGKKKIEKKKKKEVKKSVDSLGWSDWSPYSQGRKWLCGQFHLFKLCMVKPIYQFWLVPPSLHIEVLLLIQLIRNTAMWIYMQESWDIYRYVNRTNMLVDIQVVLTYKMFACWELRDIIINSTRWHGCTK